jgi:hypothetical protein
MVLPSSFFSANKWRLGRNGPIYRPFPENPGKEGEYERVFGFLSRLPQGRPERAPAETTTSLWGSRLAKN